MQRKFAPGYGGVGRELLVRIIAVSFFATVLSTGVQLLKSYHRQVDELTGRMDMVFQSHREALSESLWSMDVRQIRGILNGIMEFPEIVAVSVEERAVHLDEPLFMQMGDVNESSDQLVRRFPVVHGELDAPIMIGELHIQPTTTPIFDNLRSQLITVLVTQGVKTFFVSFIILYIIYRVVTRHLHTLSHHIDSLAKSGPGKQLTLRTASRRENEIDKVADRLNLMSSDLEKAYKELEETSLEQKRDLAARKKAQQELSFLNHHLEDIVKQRTSELNSANQSLESFTYSVSHDLRSPLRRIMGFSELIEIELKKNSVDNPVVHRFIGKTQGAIGDMGRMIDQFLEFSRSSHAGIHPETLNLALRAQQIDRQLKEQGDIPADAGAIEFSSDHIEISIDPSLLDRVLENLLSNAYKYSSKEDKPKITVGEERVNGIKAYFVRDNGIGISAQESEAIFTPFKRSKAGSAFKGTGVGLVTVRNIIERHGGKVWARPNIDKGTTFYFTVWSEFSWSAINE